MMRKLHQTVKYVLLIFFYSQQTNINHNKSHTQNQCQGRMIFKRVIVLL